MKTEIYKHIELLTNRYPVLGSVKNEITEAYSIALLTVPWLITRVNFIRYRSTCILLTRCGVL